MKIEIQIYSKKLQTEMAPIILNPQETERIRYSIPDGEDITVEVTATEDGGTYIMYPTLLPQEKTEIIPIVPTGVIFDGRHLRYTLSIRRD
jgi:hypothetical protein